MKKLIKMPSIVQFRNIIKHISYTARFEGLDENDKPIYNHNTLPILKAKGTVKIHGTNAAVCYNVADGLWFQSKKNIITHEKDNAGFAFFADQNKDLFIDLCKIAAQNNDVDLNMNSIAIYGEWAGVGIQKGVGISEIDKSFYVFGIKIRPFDEDLSSYWVESNIFCVDEYNVKLYNIKHFETFSIDIDFNNPLLCQNKMVDMVKEVENECPVAKYFGISGIGEGIVFEIEFKGQTFRWKMKGEKHAGKSKVKKANKIDDIKLQKIIDIVEKVTPLWRLEQIYQETFDTLNGGIGDIKKTGDYLRAVIKDIMKEESDIIYEANLIPKDINAKISVKARLWFMKKLDEEAGL